MFTWLNKQGVQSDEGFALQFVDRFTAEYREADKVLTIDVEDAIVQGKPAISVSSASFMRWRGELGSIPEGTRTRIIGNVRRACEFQGLQFVLSA